MDRTRDRALPESRWHGTIPRRRLDPMAVPGIGPLHWERVQGAALPPKEGFDASLQSRTAPVVVLAIQS